MRTSTSYPKTLRLSFVLLFIQLCVSHSIAQTVKAPVLKPIVKSDTTDYKKFLVGKCWWKPHEAMIKYRFYPDGTFNSWFSDSTAWNRYDASNGNITFASLPGTYILKGRLGRMKFKKGHNADFVIDVYDDGYYNIRIYNPAYSDRFFEFIPGFPEECEFGSNSKP